MAAIILIAGGVFVLLWGVTAAFFGADLAGVLTKVDAGILAAVGAVVALLGVLNVFLGVSLLKGKAWARGAAIALAAVTAFAWLGGVANGRGIVPVALCLAVLAALLAPSSKAWFTAAG